jgi:uncharacterized protein (DUF58 family)
MLKRYLFRFYRWLSGLNFWFRQRFTAAGFLTLWGLIVSGVIGLDTNFTIAYQIFWFLLCLLGLSVAWGLLSRARFSAVRQLPRFGTVDVPLAYGVAIHNETRRRQCDLQVSEIPPDSRPTLGQFLRSREPEEEKRNWFDRLFGHYRWRWLLNKNRAFENSPQEIPVIAAGDVASLTQTLLARRRGVLELGELRVSWPDPFGLFRARHRVKTPQRVVILPKRFPVRPLNLPGTVKYQPGGVTLASSVGQSEEFVSLREYRPGDPLRHIHWRSWAKTEKPIVKEFLDEFFVRHALVLDTFCGAGQEDLFEDAVSVAASFACTIPDQESLLDLMFVGPEAYCFTAGRGVAPPERMLEILAAVTPCADQPFNSLERLILRHVAEVTSCVCVLMDWDEPRQRLVRQLRGLHVPVQAYVMRSSDGADSALDMSAVADCPECLHAVVAGKIAEPFACR